ncbi:uncharacterized protein [Periplaneta americana]|uniref:uncharacterized protein n=1 Tax=Periplaneta americana TaxID=6978 RepID=UPI0037E99A4A
MLLSQVFLAGLLVLCIDIGLSNGQYVNDEPPPPDFWKGFIPSVLKNMKNKLFKHHKNNSNSIQQITNDVNVSMTLISSDIRNVGNQFSKFGSQIRTLINLGNSSDDLVGKAITVGVQTASIAANLLEMANILQRTFNDVYQGFNRIFDGILTFVDYNVQFTTDFVTYIPREVGKKLKVIYDQLMEILNVIKNILLAALDQVHILVIKGAIAILKGGLPFQQFIQKSIDQLEVLINKIGEQVTILQSTLINILTNIKTISEAAIKSSLTSVRQGFESILSRVKAIGDQLQQQLFPASGKKASPTIMATAAATTAAPDNHVTTTTPKK